MTAWTDEHRRLALALYCRLPFGLFHARNATIVSVAAAMGRTPSSLAMKLCNFASLDPEIVRSGRRGLGNVSEADRAAWLAFEGDREGAIDWAEARLEEVGVAPPLGEAVGVQAEYLEDEVVRGEGMDGGLKIGGPTEVTALVRRRRGQRFFREGVLASYIGRCCISGVADPRLLVASHIVPWRSDASARLDLRNGICLSTLHDRLFDAGIITVTLERRVCVSAGFRAKHTDAYSREAIHSLHGRPVGAPQKFGPTDAYLRHHNMHVFEGAASELVFL